MQLQQDEFKILVASEDDPTRQLLETKISKDDGYQKQQGKARVGGAGSTRLSGDRYAHRVDRAEWHRHGAQLPGTRRVREHLVCSLASCLGSHVLMRDRDFVNEVQSRLQALAQGTCVISYSAGHG